MGGTSNESKQRWNEGHYTQVKVSVDRSIATAFKEACEKSGVSMASELSAYMSKRGKESKSNPALPSVVTRRQRRKELGILIKRLERVLDAEEQGKDNIPENLSSSSVFDESERIVEAIEEALEVMREIYQ
jgi:hypothetical protein